jgi:hypothetical protein
LNRNFPKENSAGGRNDLMNIINPLLTIRSFVPAAQVAATPEERQYGLQSGQLVHATVTEGGQSHVVLDLNRQRLTAQTEIPLRTGQQLRLFIEETAPQLKLRLLKDALVDRLSHAVHLFEEKWDLPALLPKLAESYEGRNQAFEKLLNFFTAAEPSCETVFSGEKLQALVSRLGLRLEAELAEGGDKVKTDNLKSALLDMQKQLDGKDSELSESIGRTLQKIELFQLCNLRLAPQGAFMIPLPLPFLESGFLTIEDGGGRKGGADTGSGKITLFLNLKNLGELRIDMLHEEEGLFLRFTCTSQAQADFLAESEKELRSILTALPLQAASYCTGNGHFENTLIKRMISEEQELLNTRV